MQKRQDVILNTRGEPISGVSVRVVTFPVAADATIYSDDGITTTTNPLTTDANGRFAYYAADGRYSEQLSGAGITPLTVSDILLQDAVAATIPESLFHNLSLQCSIAGNALTIALKTAAGSNPSTASPVRIVFRNATATTGDHTSVAVTSATSLTISSGSLLGQIGFSFRFWIVAFNDNGIVRLGAINCSNGAADTAAIFALGGTGIASSVAEGGAGGADSYWTFYTGAAVSAKPYTVLGYLTYETVLGTPGLYNALPDRLQLFGPNVPLPGHIIQTGNIVFPSVATGTTVIPSDNTIPQISEGDQYMTITISATSGANIGVLECHINLSSSAAGTLTSALFTNSSTDALAVTANISESAGRMFQQTIRFARILGRLTPIILTVRSGNSAAGTTTFNGVAGGQLYGGRYSSYVQLIELMA